MFISYLTTHHASPELPIPSPTLRPSDVRRAEAKQLAIQGLIAEQRSPRLDATLVESRQRRGRVGADDKHQVGPVAHFAQGRGERARQEEHTSEIQSLMRITYAVLCLKKKKHVH